MDTHIVYPGQIPQDTDLLLAQKLMALSVGGLGDALFGRTVAAWGFSPTLSPEALTVTIDAGVILASGPILPTALGGQGGGLPADATVTTKQYLLPSAQMLTIPGTGGTYTLYALCSDVDTDNTLLPFWSADNPTQTQAGPNNAGTQLATRRASQVVLTLAQSAPAAPANGSVIPLMTFTVPSGATTASGVTYSQRANTFWSTIPELESGRLLKDADYTASQYFTPQTKTQLLEVEIQGAGGASASATGNSSNSVACGGPGAAGGYIRLLIDLTKVSVPAEGFYLSIGAGGLGSTAANAVGGTGGATSFGSIATANGGTGGNSTGPIAPGNSAWGGQVAGGTTVVTATEGVTVSDALTGENGQSPFVMYGTSNGIPVPLMGAAPPSKWGSSGPNATTGSADGVSQSARGFGAGGGGTGSVGAGTQYGSSGAPGKIRIREYS
ncbi:hypothetical protein ACQW08_04775 [Gluconobacter japonicus]|uniref:glycine-rich domain-containing protein n=1 Tax=Gluconobacter japonicus TaxID=376620 RepID=UPI003D2BC8A6